MVSGIVSAVLVVSVLGQEWNFSGISKATKKSGYLFENNLLVPKRPSIKIDRETGEKLIVFNDFFEEESSNSQKIFFLQERLNLLLFIKYHKDSFEPTLFRHFTLHLDRFIENLEIYNSNLTIPKNGRKSALTNARKTILTEYAKFLNGHWEIMHRSKDMLYCDIDKSSPGEINEYIQPGSFGRGQAAGAGMSPGLLLLIVELEDPRMILKYQSRGQYLYNCQQLGVPSLSWNHASWRDYTPGGAVEVGTNTTIIVKNGEKISEPRTLTINPGQDYRFFIGADFSVRIKRQ